MFLVVKKAAKLQLLIDIQCQLFDHLVLPLLLHGSEVWCAQDLRHIEIFHMKFFKCILKLYSFTPDCMVYGQTGRTELSVFVQCRAINSWYNIITGRKSKLSHLIYLIMFKLVRSKHENPDDNFHSKWIAFVKRTIDSVGFSHLWTDNPEHISHLWVKNAVKLRLNDMYKQHWISTMNVNSQCIIYCLFKEELCFEKYLKQLNGKDLLSRCKFRCRSHKLPVSYNRFHDGQYDNMCPLRDKRDVGDEFHYLLQCSYFNVERKK